MEKSKFPSIPYLPWSLSLETSSVSAGDIIVPQVFEGKEVVVTEKIDGENMTLYRDFLHSRSLEIDSRPDRDWIKAYHATISQSIPEDLKLCGEYIYSVHSIKYTSLPSYFLAFAMMSKLRVLDWDTMLFFCEQQKIPMAPVLWRGKWDKKAVEKCFTGKSLLGGEQEGYVVRLASCFPISKFHCSIAKFVRPNHVQTGENWKHERIERNILKK